MCTFIWSGRRKKFKIKFQDLLNIRFATNPEKDEKICKAHANFFPSNCPIQDFFHFANFLFKISYQEFFLPNQ